MLNRTVQINGSLYDRHEVRRFDVYVENSIRCQVTSTVSDGELSTTRSYVIQYEDGLKVAEIENQLWALPAFDEFVDVGQVLDEVLDILTDEQASTVPQAFHEWKAGVDYLVGDRVRFVETLYKCIIAHMSLEGQTPDVAVSLWAKINIPDPEVIPEWEQPSSTNPYMKGDRVTHNGHIWVSTVDNNVWEPGVYGWEIDD